MKYPRHCRSGSEKTVTKHQLMWQKRPIEKCVILETVPVQCTMKPTCIACECAVASIHAAKTNSLSSGQLFSVILISLPSTIICRPVFNMLRFVCTLSHFLPVFIANQILAWLSHILFFLSSWSFSSTRRQLIRNNSEWKKKQKLRIVNLTTNKSSAKWWKKYCLSLSLEIIFSALLANSYDCIPVFISAIADLLFIHYSCILRNE